METIKDLFLLIAKTYFLFLAVLMLYFSLFLNKLGFYKLSNYIYVKSIKYAKNAIS